MRIEVSIPDEMCDHLEALMYETNARRDLCMHMIDSGMRNSENFKEYHKEYLDLFREYEQLKHQLESEYVTPKYPNARWNLNFETSMLEIDPVA